MAHKIHASLPHTVHTAPNGTFSILKMKSFKIFQRKESPERRRRTRK
jgi:hypothetical protein